KECERFLPRRGAGQGLPDSRHGRRSARREGDSVTVDSRLGRFARVAPLLRKLLAATCWAYLAFVLAVWLLIRCAGDRWWPATIMLYGPRWVWAVPAVGPAPFALIYRRRLLWVLGIALAIIVGPVM